MAPSSSRDSWERLVAAVLKREQIWQLCHQDSISTVTSRRPSDSSGEVLSVWSNRSRRISVSPSHQRTVASSSGLQEDPQLHFGQVRRFSLHEVQSATDNFHGKNIIGLGIHSEIYQGRLEDCSLVAVKRLTAGLQEVEKELEITSIASHCNVLRLCGFCITENERMLVYPYMVNGSVASRLRERDESLPPLDWPVRKQIALGTAKGLAYLHYECLRKVIHRDVKAANVLLDEDFRAVVADFNLAEFTDCYDGDVTVVKGTLGHIAPEYLATGKYSVKADVFGYGVFLLELITAQKSYDPARGSNEDDVMLLDRMKRSYKEKKWKMIVDADLQGDFADEEVDKLLQIAMICTQTDPGRRPTMLEVVWMLEFGYGLAEKWEEWWKKGLKDETMELGHVRRFTVEELQHATKDFSNKIISKDGFNMVYRGYLDGSPVAVKSYNSQSLEYYYQKELDIGRTCLHPNVVHVIGFVQTPEERLLVYRLMVNGNVESWLRGRHVSRRPLTWQKRKEIALGAARGLFYLHDKCRNKIIHRDIKAANIFLDENFEAVVGDLKLAKVMDRNGVRVTAAVRGTIGHIAPEYLASGECSDKTDVYSYGIFLLELVTGQSASDILRLFKNDDNLLIDWVKRRYELGKWEGMVDEDCRGGFVETVVKQLLQIALLCTQHAPDERPRISEVMWMLEDGDGSAWRPLKEAGKEDGSSVGIVDDSYIDYDSGDGIGEELSGPR